MRGFILTALGRFDEALPFLVTFPPHQGRSLLYENMWDRWRDDRRFINLIANLGRTSEYAIARAEVARLAEEQTKEGRQ